MILSILRIRLSLNPWAQPSTFSAPSAEIARPEATHQNNSTSAEIQSQLRSAEQRQNSFLELMKEEMREMKRNQEAFQQQMQSLIRGPAPQMNNQPQAPPQMNNQPQVNSNQLAPSVYAHPVYSYIPTAPPGSQQGTV